MKRRRTRLPVVQSVLAVAGLLALLLLAACGGGSGSAAPVAPDVPTTVFGRQARDLAVGVSAQRSGSTVTLKATVIAQDGTPKRGLQVAAAGDGGWVAATPCGAGRYCGEVAVRGPTPQLRLRLTRPSGTASTVSMQLPRHPQPERATAIVHASGLAIRRMKSMIIDEVLGSGPPYPPLLTQFAYVAPDQLTYTIKGSGSAIVIGSTRWDQPKPGGPWQKSAQEPTRVPVPDWRLVHDASLFGASTRDGRTVDVVTFYDPTVPAWFEIDVDRETKLPLWLRMTAAAHFMTHTFGGFNAPITILPPT